MVSQDLEAVIHAEGEHVAVVGRHRVVIAAVGTVRVGILGRKGQGILKMGGMGVLFRNGFSPDEVFPALTAANDVPLVPVHQDFFRHRP